MTCNQQTERDNVGHTAVHGPSDLAGHEASWQDIDPLKEPGRPHQQEQATDKIESYPH
jgi:hypothetical protein